MSNSAPTLDHDSINWVKLSSGNGNAFEAGTLKPELATKTEMFTSSTAKKDFGIAVNWPLGSRGWKDTPEDVKNIAGITRYALYSGDGSFDYILHFTNTEHYDYYFYDKTGDSYHVNTFRNGDHYVRYDSADPSIVFIKGN